MTLLYSKTHSLLRRQLWLWFGIAADRASVQPRTGVTVVMQLSGLTSCVDMIHNCLAARTFPSSRQETLPAVAGIAAVLISVPEYPAKPLNPQLFLLTQLQRLNRNLLNP